MIPCGGNNGVVEHDLSSPGAFRYLATGTPGTDTYVARGPRQTVAEFDGFRDGEFLFAVPHIGLADLDANDRFEELRRYLTIALQQVWASCGSRIAWLFQTASDADALRDDVVALVASQRENFPDASLDIRVPEVTGLLGEQTPSGRRVVRAEDILDLARESTSADFAPTRLLPLGRPLGYLNEERKDYGVEFGGRAITIPTPAATIWLALREQPAHLGRPLGALDLERLGWSHQTTPEEALEGLRREGLVHQSWSEDITLASHLTSLRLLPLRTFATDPASPTGIVATARAARRSSPATTPVSALMRDILALGPLHNDLFEAIGEAWVQGVVGELDSQATSERIAEEVLALLADDVVYLDAPAQACQPGNPVDPSRLDPVDADLYLLPIGFVVDATDDVPTALRVAGQPESLDADEGPIWALVRDLDTVGVGEGQVRELLAAAGQRGLSNSEQVLDRLMRRGLVHRVRGPRIVEDLGRFQFRPLLAGLTTVGMLRSCSGPKPVRLLGASGHQAVSAELGRVATLVWDSSGTELPSLAHTLARLSADEADPVTIRFGIDRVRSLVRQGAGYLDARAGGES